MGVWQTFGWDAQIFRGRAGRPLAVVYLFTTIALNCWSLMQIRHQVVARNPTIYLPTQSLSVTTQQGPVWIYQISSLRRRGQPSHREDEYKPFLRPNFHVMGFFLPRPFNWPLFVSCSSHAEFYFRTVLLKTA